MKIMLQSVGSEDPIEVDLYELQDDLQITYNGQEFWISGEDILRLAALVVMQRELHRPHPLVSNPLSCYPLQPWRP